MPQSRCNDAEILERLRRGDSALKDSLTHLVSHVMVPRPDNFMPVARTPWGGTRILNDIKRGLTISDRPEDVGESWELSAQPSFPSCFPFDCEGRWMTVNLPALERIFPQLHLPYLVKILNSGCDRPRGNLSVQVHPSAADPNLKSGEGPKDEAWIIIDAEPGAGIYLGLKEGVTRQIFEQALKAGQDVTSFLNFVGVHAGDVFFVPSGVVHAIGAGVLLLEPQESSETTYRIYDYGRRDVRGQLRELHVDRAMETTRWDGPRGMAAVNALRRVPQPISGPGEGALVERLVAEKAFTVSRITLQPQQEFRFNSTHSVIGLVFLSGAVTVHSGGKKDLELRGGQSCLIPQSLGDCSFVNSGKIFSVFFQITSP